MARAARLLGMAFGLFRRILRSHFACFAFRRARARTHRHRPRGRKDRHPRCSANFTTGAAISSASRTAARRGWDRWPHDRLGQDGPVQTRGWVVFALSNPTDKPITRWLTAQKYDIIGSRVLKARSRCARASPMSRPSLGFRPERNDDYDHLDIYRFSIEPGTTVTFHRRTGYIVSSKALPVLSSEFREASKGFKPFSPGFFSALRASSPFS